MADPEELMRQLGAMMSGVNSAELVQKIVDLYDSTAQSAYERLLDVEGELASPEETAKLAWEYADAMMAERAKRGIGRLPKHEDDNG